MGDINAFSQIGNTVTIAATTSSANAPIAAGGPSATVRIVNESASTAYVAIGGPGVTATTGSLPILAGGFVLLSSGGLGYGAAMLASGTGNVYFTTGLGF